MAFFKFLIGKATAATESPSLFLSSFPKKSDTIRLSFTAPGNGSYIEIDSVLLIGATARDIASLNSSTVYYEQDPDSDYYYFENNDTFSFIIDDSNYYMMYRDVEESAGVITLNISAVNDAPHAPNETISFKGTITTFVINTTDPDGPDSLLITITSLPTRGNLRILSEDSDSVDTLEQVFYFSWLSNEVD